ncbi:MAG: cytochrome c, partial [Gemmatimonadetes bacterium]|nr:cytochrome c [Gemmatimonadota bacterium]
MHSVNQVLWIGALLGAVALGYPLDASAQRSGVEIWSENCGRCHLPQPANRYTADQWETIVSNMRLVARLTDADAEAVLEFLSGGA